MNRLKFVLICFFITSLQVFAEMPDYEKTVRKFLYGLIDRDKQLIKQTCLDHHNLDILWKRKALSDEARKAQKYELDKTQVEWLKVGDTFRHNNHVLTVNENMVTSKRQIARVKLLEYGYPIPISKVAGQWSVQPLLIVDIYKRELMDILKENRKDYTINIDGQDVQVNEGETLELQLADGRKVNVQLTKNLIQNYSDDQIKLSYSRDLNFSKHATPECMIYRFKSELTANIMIQAYPKTMSLDKQRDYVLKSFIENYGVAEYILEETPVRQVKTSLKGKTVSAQEIYSKRNGVVHVDHFVFWEEQDKIIGGVLQMELKDSSAGRDFFNHIINDIELKQASVRGAK